MKEYLKKSKASIKRRLRQHLKIGEFTPEGAITILTRPPRGFLYTIFLPLPQHLDTITQQTIQTIKKGLGKENDLYRLNPIRQRITKIVHALNSYPTLMWAIKAKENGKIENIIAGPFQSMDSPITAVLANPMINRVVVLNSSQKKNFFKTDQYLEQKTTIWHPGVEKTPSLRKNNGNCVLYAEGAPENLFHDIIRMLWEKGVKLHIAKTPAQFTRMYKKANFSIQISTTGNLQQCYQSWMADIPTLAWQNENIEIPPPCGETFAGSVDFKFALDHFQKNLPNFLPRQYALNNVSHAAKAAEYIAIIRGAGTP